MPTPTHDIVLAEFILSGGEISTLQGVQTKHGTTDDSAITAAQERLLAALPRLSHLYREIELPVSELIGQMHEVGIYINRARLKEVEETLTKRRDSLRSSLTRTLGDINLNSPRQLGDVLVTKYQMTLPKTKTGQWSTSYDALEPLRQYEIVGEILDYRAVDKILGTYISPLTGFIGEDGRIHPTYIQTVASTGRLGCKDPNIQSTPITGEYGALVRSCYTAEPGSILIGADYSQQELRILAHLSGDTKLRHAFESGVDVHIQTASEILGIPLAQVTREQRSVGKVLNFGIVYGETSFGLTRQLGRPVAECEAILKKYFETYSGVKDYFDELLARAMREGRVETMMGRLRGVPGSTLGTPAKYLRADATRIIKNFPIQGSAADMTKVAMVRVTRDVLPRYPGARLIMQIHDELIFEYAPVGPSADLIQSLQSDITACMRDAVPLSVPVEVTSSIGERWDMLK